MLSALKDWIRLLYAGHQLIQTDLVHSLFLQLKLPTFVLWLARFGRKPKHIEQVLEALGPAYVKLGQSLAARPDLIGDKLAKSLAVLQDQMQPFGMELARKILENQVGVPLENTFIELSEPVAAASISQVHKAQYLKNGTLIPVAVKILRPNIKKIIAADLNAFARAARLLENVSAEMRRLGPTQTIEVLKQSVAEELDLRLEAASLTEIKNNLAKQSQIRIPQVIWPATFKDVLTTHWIDATPLTDHNAIAQSGLNLEQISQDLMQTFLRQALHDGVFHADMHQGNLMIDKSGHLVMLDFGIVGRLEPKERHFLAQILWSFIKGDYDKGAQVHFDAGYVPKEHSVKAFASALRSIGTPILDKTAEEISMGKVLSQLFDFTSHFGMQTRPELLLLQKTMVVTEGVARSLNPKLDIWRVSEPIVREFLENEIGIKGRLKAADETLHIALNTAQKIPQIVESAQSALDTYHEQMQSKQDKSELFQKFAISAILLLVVFLVVKSL